MESKSTQPARETLYERIGGTPVACAVASRLAVWQRDVTGESY